MSCEYCSHCKDLEALACVEFSYNGIEFFKYYDKLRAEVYGITLDLSWNGKEWSCRVIPGGFVLFGIRFGDIEVVNPSKECAVHIILEEIERCLKNTVSIFNDKIRVIKVISEQGVEKAIEMMDAGYFRQENE